MRRVIRVLRWLMLAPLLSAECGCKPTSPEGEATRDLPEASSHVG